MQDKIIWISGGTGSFGKAMCLELLTKGVRQVRIFSRDELKQSQMREEIKDSRVDFHLGDVRDLDRVKTSTEGVDIIIHAAAMKRIEKCEHDPDEAIKTNVLGTLNVAKAALLNNVEKAIFISTDKAAYPVNLYGATKLTAEKVWVQSNTYRGTRHPTKFSVVRYGNVLGSRGSVLHLFQDQKNKGCLKVTDTRMTRFFITLQEAVDLVQLGFETMQGGETLIPNLKALNIYSLACFMAGSLPVEITCQRGGEKLHEVLITQEECRRTTCHPTHMVVHPEITTWPYTRDKIDNPEFVTSETAAQYNERDIKRLISAL